jgi:hypothetical protein
MAKKGRKTKYHKEYDKQVYKLCLLNATDAQIADYFGVSESTLNLWKLKHKDFSESIKDGKIRADAEVAKSLHSRAVGYSHPDVHISNYQGDITITEITKHYPPDTAAAFIWLKNRQGWTDKKDIVLKDDRYTPEQRDAIRAKLAERCVNES